nr:hypothetical protein [Pandoravirus massiliensis]
MVCGGIEKKIHKPTCKSAAFLFFFDPSPSEEDFARPTAKERDARGQKPFEQKKLFLCLWSRKTPAGRCGVRSLKSFSLLAHIENNAEGSKKHKKPQWHERDTRDPTRGASHASFFS